MVLRCAMKPIYRVTVWVVLLAVLSPVFAKPAEESAAVASAHPDATAAGMEILAAGGNAFDAAVAVSAALAVVQPYGSGFGGGGFWLLHRESDGRQVMIDGRERAPLAATADMYLDENGEPIDGLSLDGPLAAGIPGMPAALVHIAEHYGQLSLDKNLAPAVRLAREGFKVDEHLSLLAAFRLPALRASQDAKRIFLMGTLLPPLPVFSLKQPDLARTIEALAAEGREGFYEGDVARLLVDGVREAGGIWTMEDLSSYRVVEREPIVFKYKGIRVVSAPPPSSGGVVLAEALNVLSGFDLDALSEVDRVHVIVEAMRRAYRDRAVYLGDPDFVDMPLSRLLSASYADRLRSDIKIEQATPSEALAEPRSLGEDTTHFSIVDRHGNRVAATLSINYPFGSGFVPPGTGVLLNNEMDDFSIKPGVGNAYGLVGGDANAIAPGKRMLSSMSPTFLETPERVAVLGTPGGSRIISMVLLGSLVFAEGGSAADMVSTGRYHHQYLPDKISYEPDGLSPALIDALEKKGHQTGQAKRAYGDMQVVVIDRRSRRLAAASDPRRRGEAVVIPALPKPAVLPLH
ncbi:MAG: gamma-glutamyltransferase [Pseudomonadota bacterium]|nr:gamma-glutamyltransferase [Pseudomonadota bacterium]